VGRLDKGGDPDQTGVSAELRRRFQTIEEALDRVTVEASLGRDWR
jgi:hypothetical protein